MPGREAVMRAEREIRIDFNYLLNTAKMAAKQAARLRQVEQEIKSKVQTLDEIEEFVLGKLKELTGKDFRAYALEHNYGRKKT
jgi:galactose mutarotase-like enzyme